MRPHVEFIHEDDYIWHPAELTHAHGDAVQRNLSYDEETGAASLRVDFRSDFDRPAGTHAADTEWFVLDGSIQIGDTHLGEGGYLHAPAGGWTPAIRAAKGTRILLFREDTHAFQPLANGNPDTLTILDTQATAWQKIEGKPGLEAKVLHRSSQPGVVSLLASREVGYSDPRYQHHETLQEGYYLSGSQYYNYGHLRPGSYFFRPGGVLYGDYTMPNESCVLFLRLLGDPQPSFYTRNPGLVVTGESENYDVEANPPVPSGFPVRSRSAGTWRSALNSNADLPGSRL